MSQKYLITGLPRCRTAWFAEVCETPKSRCFHEPIKYLNHWRDIYGIWSENSPYYIGISDSSLGFHLGEILDIAAPRTLIIYRPVEDVENSLRKKGFPVSTNYCSLLEERLETFQDHPLVLTVPFCSLKSVDCVVNCLYHLMPGNRIDFNRLDQLMDVNIQVDTDEVIRTAFQRRGDFTSLLGEDVIQALRNK